MKALLAAMCLMTFPSAGDKAQPKANTLTPQEAKEGWLLLFDGATAFGWHVDGQVEVKDGVIVLGGNKKTTVWLEFGQCELKLDYQWVGKAPPARLLSGSRTHETRLPIPEEYHESTIGGGPGFGGPYQSTGQAKKMFWRTDHYRIELGPEQSVRRDTSISIRGGFVLNALNADPCESFFLTLPCGAKYIRATLGVPEGTKLSIRNVKVKPIAL